MTPVGPGSSRRVHVPASPGRPATRRRPAGGFRDRTYDRVGGSRLTGFGVVLLMLLGIGAANPPRPADRAVMGLIVVGLLTVLVLGVVWPLVAVRMVRVTAECPRDAVVGEQVPLWVRVTGRAPGLEVRALDPTGRWHAARAPSEGELLHLADRRGVFHLVRIEVRMTGPLGVLAAHRVHNIALPFGVEVAPRPLEVRWLPAAAPVEGVQDVAIAAGGGVDLVRSVRPYAPGDPARLVHWPSTARTGMLVVREMEPPAPYGQAIVVDLQGLGPDADRAAAYGLGAALAVLSAGGQLVFCTCEQSGPVTGRIRHPIDAARRMARAIEGPPGEPPEGWPIVEIGA